MYSELYRLSIEHGKFIQPNTGKTNLVLKKSPVGGNHVKVVIDENGNLVRIITEKQDRNNKELMLQACMDNMNIFPKINISRKFGVFLNIPPYIKGKTDFSNFIFDIDPHKIKKVAGYCKDTLLPEFLNKGQKNGVQQTMFGESVISFDRANLKSLFESVFKELIKMSKVNDIAQNILENFVFLDDEEKVPGSKAVMMICVEKNGKLSTDIDEYDSVADIVPTPKTIILSNGKGEMVKTYCKLPKYDFPIIGPLAIYARNEDSSSMSVYGKYGTSACVIPVDRFNRVVSFLSEIFPIDGIGVNFLGVPVSKMNNGGLLGVVYDEEYGQKDLIEFLKDDCDSIKKGSFGKWQNNMINAIKRMEETDDDYPVDFILISKVDKATSGLSLNLHRNKKDVLMRIKQWREMEMPMPSVLLTCMKYRLRFDGSHQIIAVENSSSFGYDQIIKFIFGDDKDLNLKIIKTIYDNIKVVSSINENVKMSKINGFDPEFIIESSLKFINYAIKKGNEVNNKTLESVAHLCKIANRIQIEYWKEHNIKGKFSRNIGGDILYLFQSYRHKEGYMNLIRGVQKYIDWAESKVRLGESVKLAFMLAKFRSEIKNIDVDSLFSSSITDIDIARMTQIYLSFDPSKKV